LFTGGGRALKKGGGKTFTRWATILTFRGKGGERLGAALKGATRQKRKRQGEVKKEKKKRVNVRKKKRVKKKLFMSERRHVLDAVKN